MELNQEAFDEAAEKIWETFCQLEAGVDLCLDGLGLKARAGLPVVSGRILTFRGLMMAYFSAENFPHKLLRVSVQLSVERGHFIIFKALLLKSVEFITQQSVDSGRERA